MWKREETQGTASAPAPQPTATPAPAPTGPGRAPREHAAIGPSITIRGEVSGDEDLLIQGRVEGTVDLKQQRVTVGPEGKVKADITGRVVTIEGEVEGNLKAEEQVVLRSSARVQGDISAPRVVLEDGATFRGGIDMGDRSGPKGRTATGSAKTAADSSVTSTGSAAAPRSGAGSREAPELPIEAQQPGEKKLQAGEKAKS